MVTMRLPIELLIEYFLRLVWITISCVASVLRFDFSCLGPQTTQIPTPPLQITCTVLSLMFIWIIRAFVEDADFDSLQYYLRFPEGLPVRLRERWVMKILFTSYCQKRINHLSQVLSIGILFPIHYPFYLLPLPLIKMPLV